MSRSLFFVLLLSWQAMVSGDDLTGAIADFDNRDYQSAASKFEKLRSKNSKDADILFYLAKSQYKTNNYREANATIEYLTDLHPDYKEAYNLAGMVYMALLAEVNIFKKMGMARSAIDSWQRVLDLDANHVMGNYAFFSYYLNAPGLAGGDIEKAREVLARLEKISPPYAELAKGLLNSKLDNTVEAEKHYLRATQLIEDHAGPHLAIAQFYFKNDEFKKSLASFERYQQGNKVWQDPSDAIAFYFLGNIHAKLGNIELARKNFTSALSAFPNKQIQGLVKDALGDL